MKSEKEFIPDPAAAQYGIYEAMLVAFQSLILTHHDAEKLVERLKVEAEAARVRMLNSHARDAAIEMFDSTMHVLIPTLTRVSPTQRPTDADE